MATNNALVDVWPGCDSEATGNGRNAETVLWGVLLVVMAADAALTVTGLERGLHEGNIVVRTVIHAYGPIGVWFVKAGAVGIGAAVASVVSARTKPLIPLALALPTAFAVAVNITLFAML